MKKNILAAVLFAAFALNAFGAACQTGTMAQQAALGACQINGWNLDVWSFGQGGTNQAGYGPTAVPLLSDVLVTFSTFGDGVNTAFGFTVTFSDNPDVLTHDYF